MIETLPRCNPSDFRGELTSDRLIGLNKDLMVLKRVLPFLLLLGALTGLFGQEVAFARGANLASPVAAAQQMVGMDGMDCAGRMMESPSDHGGPKPCKGMTPDCMAQMGCVSPALLDEGSTPTTVKPLASKVFYWSSTSRLIGRSYAPELDPPSLLN